MQQTNKHNLKQHFLSTVVKTILKQIYILNFVLIEEGYIKYENIENCNIEFEVK